MENGESSAGATITIVLLLGLIILVSSYIVYDRVYSNRDNDQKISEQPIINDNYDLLDISSDFIKNLYDNASHHTGRTCTYLDSIIDSGVKKTSDFANNTLLSLAYNNINQSLINKVDETKEYIKFSLKGQYLKEAFIETFGENATYKSGDFTDAYHMIWTYDGSSDMYVGIRNLQLEFSKCFLDQHEQIIEAKKYNNKIEIITVSVYCNDNACYSDFSAKNKVGDSILSDYRSLKDKLNKYKYTFTSSKDKSKYFYYSIEKMND